MQIQGFVSQGKPDKLFRQERSGKSDIVNDDTGSTAETAQQKDTKTSGIVWNDAEMATSFANVVNIQSTREQVDLFLGVNRSWDARADGPVQVDISNRVILTPYAAKRMLHLLNGVLREYEARYGVLKVDDK